MPGMQYPGPSIHRLLVEASGIVFDGSRTARYGLAAQMAFSSVGFSVLI